MTATNVRRAQRLEETIAAFHEARDAQEKAFEDGRRAAVIAMDAGVASERSVAEAFGLDRNTVRAWRGKARIR